MKNENIFTPFIHVLAFSRLLGLLQLSTPKNYKLSKYKIYFFKNAWILILVPINAIMFYNSIRLNKRVETGNWLNNAVDSIKILLGGAMLLFMVVLTPFRKENFIHLLYGMQDIDDELKILPVAIPYVKIKRRVNIIFYSAIFTAIAYSILQLYMQTSSETHIGVYRTASLFVHVTTEIQFVIFVLEIEYRLKLLNDWLVKYHTSNRISSDIYWVTPVGAMSSHLSVISRLHDKICILAKKSEEMYAFRILLIISLNFITITFSSYYCFSSLYKEREFSHFFSSMIAVIFDTCQLFVITVAAAGASNECYRTAEILHRLERSQRSDSKDKIDVTLFSLQILHGRINFTACGLFPLNFSLLQSIMGAVTTYLVIIVQFDITGQNKRTTLHSIANRSLNKTKY